MLKYSKNFWIICFGLLFFMTSFNLILPELNEFITDIGGGDQKGLIIALFAITALISRPFSGKLSDTIGRKKVMYIGMGVAVVVSLLYPLFTSVGLFLYLRLMHGFSAGFLPTGATALVTDILPPEKRGVGMGLWGVFISLGFGGQAIGSIIRTEFGMTFLFITAACFAIASGILISFLKETLPNPIKFKWSLLKVTWQDVFEPSVIPAAIVMFIATFSTGIVLALTPDMSTFFDIQNKGWFLGFYAFSTIFIRLFASGLSDKIGRRKTLIFGLSLMVICMALVALSTEWKMYTFAAVLFGISTGISSPTLMAWTADLSHKSRRGVGAGTLFIALEFGIMFGSTSTMFTYDNSLASIPYAFGAGAIMAIIGVLYLMWHLAYRHSNT
ncbi:MAG: MFS transporter [Crocinitomicaceae bacterium]|nr:MFS transporter [Crocinitomicaceae bacterium]